MTLLLEQGSRGQQPVVNRMAVWKLIQGLEVEPRKPLMSWNLAA